MELTLVLNSTYEPLDVVDWQRAMTLWAQDKVEIVDTYNRECKSVKFEFKLPSVVRLRHYVRSKKRQAVPFTRANIYIRDDYTCQYCDEEFDACHLTFDHVVPVSQGGPRTWENIVTACRDCNRRKADKTLAQAGMTLKHKPVRPSFAPQFRVSAGTRRTPSCWREYLYWNVDAA